MTYETLCRQSLSRVYVTRKVFRVSKVSDVAVGEGTSLDSVHAGR